MTQDPELSPALKALGFTGRAVLAPMSGVTDVPFRRIASRFGAGLVVSEMVASEAFVVGHEEMRLKAESDGIEVPVVQLAGREPRWMAEAAKLAEQSGAAIIDINMGCPAKKVVSGLSGSALMRDLELAQRLIVATVSATSVPVTLKMRLGWDHDSINAPQLAQIAEGEGVQLITVHGRTRNQFYKGKADWSAIHAVRDAMSLPLIANGDLTRPEDAPDMLTASGADAVMIGRGAYGAPWIVGQTSQFLANGRYPPAPSGASLAVVIAEHYEAMLAHYGTALGVRQARKHLDWYLQTSTVNASPDQRLQLMKAEEPKEVLALIADLFGDAIGGHTAERNAA
ncbi:MAG: tRNA dihydrouridine synthase DusB [Pseudomonadota bacterium]